MVDKPMLRMLDFVIPDVTFHWCALGLTLLSQDTHGIETNHDKDVEKTCAKMLSIWLETHTKETRHKLLVAAELKEKLNATPLSQTSPRATSSADQLLKEWIFWSDRKKYVCSYCNDLIADLVLTSSGHLLCYKCFDVSNDVRRNSPWWSMRDGIRQELIMSKDDWNDDRTTQQSMINKLLLKGDKCEVQCTMEECTVEQCTMEQSTMEQYKKFAFSFAPEEFPTNYSFSKFANHLQPSFTTQQKAVLACSSHELEMGPITHNNIKISVKFARQRCNKMWKLRFADNWIESVDTKRNICTSNDLLMKYLQKDSTTLLATLNAKILRLESENEELKSTIKKLQDRNLLLKSKWAKTTKRNVKFENEWNKIIQLVKETDKKLNILREQLERQVKKQHKKYQRKLKIIREEKGTWKEQYNQLKKDYELQSMELKNRETYWETRYEDLEKQNDDLVNYIAGFPKRLEAVKKRALLSV